MWLKRKEIRAGMGGNPEMNAKLMGLPRVGGGRRRQLLWRFHLPNIEPPGLGMNVLRYHQPEGTIGPTL
jgi:hypothetical protein